MRLIAYLVVLLTIVMTLSIKPVMSGDSPRQVGMVIYLNAQTDHYKLKRNDQIYPVAVATILEDKDVLSIECGRSDKESKTEEISITLQLAEGEKHLTCKDSPYKIKSQYLTKENNAQIKIGNFLDWAGKVIATSLDSLQSKTYSAIVRGDNTHSHSQQSLPLYMPIICRAGGRMETGRSDLHLAWIGGYPPFKLRLTEANGHRVLAEREEVEASSITLHRLDLLPDNYELVITDAKGRTMKRHFQVVVQESVPMPPHVDFTDIKDPPLARLRETAYAAWLSDQNRGVWTLEAYQRVADIAPVYYPAELMRRKLADGL